MATRQVLEFSITNDTNGVTAMTTDSREVQTVLFWLQRLNYGYTTNVDLVDIEVTEESPVGTDWDGTKPDRDVFGMG